MDTLTPTFEDELILLMPKLKNYAFSLTKNSHNCEDLVGETILSALNNKSKFTSGTNLKAWLCTIMYNRFVNGYRHKVKFGKKVDIIDFKCDGYSIESDINTKLYLQHIYDFMDCQDERLIEPMILYSKGYGYEEIADMIDVPLGTVKSRIFHMRKKLKQIA